MVAGLVVVGGVCLVGLVAVVLHARNMREASLVCEVGTPSLGGVGEPDLCFGAGSDLVFAEHGAQHLLDPWPSALVAGATILAAGALGALVLARLRGPRPVGPRAVAVASGAGLTVFAGMSYLVMIPN